MRLKTNTKRISRTTSVPSPVGGINARDSYADMAPTDAVKMDNWFCLPSSIQLRYGFSNFATGLGSAVNTIMAYNSATTQKLIAVAGTNFYDVTAGGAVGAAVTTCTDSKWQHVNFSTLGGFYLSCVNGVDSAKLFDGTTWTNPTINGVTSSNLFAVMVHMNRLWYIEKGTRKVWYLGISAISGDATAFDLSQVFRRGGYLAAMGSWTMDAGSGMDDHAVFISSEGEVAVYRGTDPASINTWSIVGVYQIGSPVGRRCMSQYASDLLIICQDGLMPLSKALMSSRVSNKVSLTDKIQHIVSQDVTEFGVNFGWQCRLFPQANMLLLNVPAGTGINYQYAMNTISGSWSRFIGWDAQSWEMYKDQIYFGNGSGTVCKAWDTFADAGSNINSEVVQAFNYFGTQSLKHFKLSRPIFNSNTQALGITSGLNFDFNFNEPQTSPTIGASSSTGVWGVSKWSMGSKWGASNSVRSSWQTSGGIGYCAGTHISTSSNTADLTWQSTTFVYEIGGGF